MLPGPLTALQSNFAQQPAGDELLTARMIWQGELVWVRSAAPNGKEKDGDRWMLGLLGQDREGSRSVTDSLQIAVPISEYSNARKPEDRDLWNHSGSGGNGGILTAVQEFALWTDRLRDPTANRKTRRDASLKCKSLVRSPARN
jgi:hypothetical protein